MWVDIGIFGFMIIGSLGGAVQHLFNFEDVAKDLTPMAFNFPSKSINPAAKFWGGDFLASVFLAQAGMAILYCRNPLVREAYMVLTGLMFSSVAVAWWRKGESVGNTNKLMVIGMDLALGILSLAGALLTRRERRASSQKTSKSS